MGREFGHKYSYKAHQMTLIKYVQSELRTPPGTGEGMLWDEKKVQACVKYFLLQLALHYKHTLQRWGLEEQSGVFKERHESCGLGVI